MSNVSNEIRWTPVSTSQSVIIGLGQVLCFLICFKIYRYYTRNDQNVKPIAYVFLLTCIQITFALAELAVLQVCDALAVRAYPRRDMTAYSLRVWSILVSNYFTTAWNWGILGFIIHMWYTVYNAAYIRTKNVLYYRRFKRLLVAGILLANTFNSAELTNFDVKGYYAQGAFYAVTILFQSICIMFAGIFGSLHVI